MLAKWCFLTATSPQCSLALYLASGRFIKRTSEILREEYDDDIPPDYEGLLKLPGVGPKMAHLTMQCAWHKYVPLIQFLQGRLSLTFCRDLRYNCNVSVWHTGRRVLVLMCMSTALAIVLVGCTKRRTPRPRARYLGALFLLFVNVHF
jgi:hypothetical protein